MPCLGQAKGSLALGGVGGHALPLLQRCLLGGIGGTWEQAHTEAACSFYTMTWEMGLGIAYPNSPALPLGPCSPIPPSGL